MKNSNLDLKNLPAQLAAAGRRLNAYRVVIFVMAAAGLYLFIIWRINAYSNVPASDSEKSAKTVTQPRIDPDVIAKIESLQDNSVNVKTLFDAARDNPFQE